MKIQIEWDKKSKKLLDLMKNEWEERVSALRASIAYDAANNVYQDILTKIPRKPEMSEYRKAVKLAKVASGGNEVGYAVIVRPKRKNISKFDQKSSLLYVVPLRRLRRIYPEIKILEQYSPWTVSTLPFYPDKSLAKVVVRNASQASIDKREKQLKRSKLSYTSQLARAGKRTKKNKKLAENKKRNQTAIPEVNSQGAALEFGDMARSSRPHWKPSIIRFMRSTLPIMGRDKLIGRTLLDPSYTGWRKTPPNISNTIQSGELRQFAEFVKRLGLKF